MKMLAKAIRRGAVVGIIFFALASPRLAHGQASLAYRFDSACATRQMAFVVNTAAKTISVTVRITSTVTGNTQTQDVVISVAANGQTAVGCTDEGAVPPYIHHTFKIISVH